MHFCMTAKYTPKSLNAILENPKTNRQEAAKKLVEAAGGKLISMYSTAANGPGVLVIFDVPDPSSASAMSGVVIASGAVHNSDLHHLLEEFIAGIQLLLLLVVRIVAVLADQHHAIDREFSGSQRQRIRDRFAHRHAVCFREPVPDVAGCTWSIQSEATWNGGS